MRAFFLCQGFLLAMATAATLTDEEVESLSFKSIKAIHKHLDDDQDGDVNLEESTEFMVDELHLNDKRRHSSFHGNDSLISVEDLWISWLQSEVHNWTTKDVADWLSDTVSLPQYKENFTMKKIDGRMLPRFTNEASSLYNELGITNAKHRKKISLRATDIVLFGPPIKGYAKDVILAIVIGLMSLACWYAMSEKKTAKKQIEQMMKDVEFMQQAEQNLKSTQEKLKKAELEHRSTALSKAQIEDKLKKEIDAAKKEAERLHEERNHHEEERIKMSLVEQELVEVRKALQKAESEMESMAPKSPKSLQQWLYITYRKESKNFISKKNNALRQMEDAKSACEKIRKKRGAFLGSLRIVHGQTIDEVDQKILCARSALAEVTNDLQERQHRWRQIEELCGFSIVSDGILNPSLEIEDQSRRSSIARALAVCANLGGIGSIPGSSSTLPKESKSSNQDNPNGSNRQSRASSGVYPGFVELSEASSSKSSPVKELLKESLFDVGDTFKDKAMANEALSRLSSQKDPPEPHEGELVSGLLDRIQGRVVLLRGSSYPNGGEFRNDGSVKSNHHSNSAVESSGVAKFQESHSVPSFSPETQTVGKAFEIDSSPFTDIKRSASLNGSDSSLSKVGMRHDNSSHQRTSLASSEENLSQFSSRERCFGSNNELRSSTSSISKKNRSWLNSLKSKKPSSFDGLPAKTDSSSESVKRKSLLSKLRKKQ